MEGPSCTKQAYIGYGLHRCHPNKNHKPLHKSFIGFWSIDVETLMSISSLPGTEVLTENCRNFAAFLR